MTATNMQELQTMLMGEIRKAMGVVSEKALADMYEETAGFYSGGEPDEYERTGALGDTPRTTAIENTGNGMKFEAFLDTNHKYDTGKNPPMLDVLYLANDQITDSSVGWLRENVGSEGFWERAVEKIGNDFESTFFQFFNARY